MSIYKGRVNCRALTPLLHTILLKEGYTEISSEITTDGRVYKSPSVKGEDLFYLRLKEANSYYIDCGVYESYIPNPIGGTPGSFGVGYYASSIIWGTNNNANSNKYDLDYVINATNKRLLIYVNPLKAQPSRISSVTYLGLPTRLNADDKTGFFAGITGSANMPYNRYHSFYPLRDRSNTTYAPYSLEFYKPSRSIGWGGELFFSPLFVTKGYEGFRGVLDGLYVIRKLDKKYDVSTGDTFVKDGKTYLIISPDVYNDTLLHQSSYDYALEI